jgi:ABC-type nickel/cobalt efflux system permease component RcnA
MAAHAESLNRLAFSATVHCLTGCSIGEVLGMVIGTALHLGNGATIALAVALAFLFGYLLTMIPLLRAKVALGTALGLAFASDTVSITIMEIVDNAIMMAIPGAMDAGLNEPKFWVSLAVSLLIAGLAAFPVVRWLVARGKGHAVVHKYHRHGPDQHHPHHHPHHH